MMNIWQETELLDDANREAIDKELRLLRTVWTGVFLALAAMVVLCEIFVPMIRRNIDLSFNVPSGLLMGILVIMAVADLGTAYFVRHTLLWGKAKIPHEAVDESEDVSKTSYLFRYLYGKLIPIIICLSVGFFGLLAFLLTGDSWRLYLFAAISAAGLLLHRPSRTQIIEYLCTRSANERSV